MQCRRIQTYTPYMVGLHFNLQNLCVLQNRSFFSLFCNKLCEDFVLIITIGNVLYLDTVEAELKKTDNFRSRHQIVGALFPLSNWMCKGPTSTFPNTLLCLWYFTFAMQPETFRNWSARFVTARTNIGTIFEGYGGPDSPFCGIGDGIRTPYFLRN